jgi:hypothetical protein
MLNKRRENMTKKQKYLLSIIDKQTCREVMDIAKKEKGDWKSVESIIFMWKKHKALLYL